ncbi:hypothetical protein A5856_002522, partial [Enterococcus faecium]
VECLGMTFGRSLFARLLNNAEA